MWQFFIFTFSKNALKSGKLGIFVLSNLFEGLKWDAINVLIDGLNRQQASLMNFHVSKHSFPLLNFIVTVAHSNKPIIIIIIIGVCM